MAVRLDLIQLQQNSEFYAQFHKPSVIFFSFNLFAQGNHPLSFNRSHLSASGEAVFSRFIANGTLFVNSGNPLFCRVQDRVSGVVVSDGTGSFGKKKALRSVRVIALPKTFLNRFTISSGSRAAG
jgi:hypothetical protein